MIRIAISQAAFEAICATLPLGSVGYENATNERGERYVWLDHAVVARLRAMRQPTESYSDVILRICGSENGRQAMVDIETIRLAFRPNRIIALFVGESPPFNGDFFYYGRTALERVMRSAIEESLGPTSGDFLETFKAYGWYLEDLVLTPVDHLRGSADKYRKRRAMCEAARPCLAQRIAEYQPLTIVSLLRSIRVDVEEAMKMADCRVEHINTPFAVNWHEKAFKKQMKPIWPSLPRLWNESRK